MRDKELFLESGKKASLWDVCEWWIQTYPDDIFVTKPQLIVKVRELMKEILSKRGSLKNGDGVRIKYWRKRHESRIND